MPKIFISYRREDSEATTGRISDRLMQEFGPESIFMDVDSMVPGTDFRERIKHLLHQTDLMAVIVGKKWVGPQRGKPLRIQRENDWVRIEVETALDRGIPLIPVLVHGAEMPDSANLPEGIKNFSFRHATRINDREDFHQHVDRLIKSIKKLLETQSASAPVSTATSSAPKAGGPLEREVRKREWQSKIAESRDPPEFPSSLRDLHLFGAGPKHILSLKGGGIRVVITLAFLERIETILSTLHRRSVSIAEFFDLIGGTSVSGLIASLLALGFRAVDVKNLFLTLAPRIFKHSWWRIPALQARFDAKTLRAEIDLLLGDRSLGSKDLLTGLCILMKRIDTGSLWVIANNPKYQYWDTPSDNLFTGNRHFPLASLIQASVAAPMFFDPAQLPIVPGMPSGYFVDGGVSLHNDPSLPMFLMSTLDAYGLRWTTGPKQLLLASIGSGSFRNNRSKRDVRSVSSTILALNALTSLLDEADDYTLSQMQLLGETHTPFDVSFMNGATDGRPFGGPHFEFLHYDVHLESQWLSALGMRVSDKELARFRAADDPAILPALYEIARVAAEEQVKIEHWAKWIVPA